MDLECTACRFFKPIPMSGGGMCRRRAPQGFLVGLDGRTGQPQFMSAWPTVGKGDWCHEFEPAARIADAASSAPD